MSAFDPKRTLVIAIPGEILHRNMKLLPALKARELVSKVSTVDSGYSENKIIRFRNKKGVQCESGTGARYCSCR